jgi:hypothetical protein
MFCGLDGRILNIDEILDFKKLKNSWKINISINESSQP